MRTVNSLCRYQRPRRRPPRLARAAAHGERGNVTRSEPLAFRWRRTAFARIDGAVESVENDWSLFVDGLSAARIYSVRGGPNDGRWFWTVQIGPGRVPFNTGPVMLAAAARRASPAKRSCERWETPKRTNRRPQRSSLRRPRPSSRNIAEQGRRTEKANLFGRMTLLSPFQGAPNGKERKSLARQSG